jgi:short-subunit dehydrogenase
LATERAKLALCARNPETLKTAAEQVRRVHGFEIYAEHFDGCRPTVAWKVVETILSGARKRYA